VGGDVIVASLDDAGIGTCVRGELSGAVAVCHPGLRNWARSIDAVGTMGLPIRPSCSQQTDHEMRPRGIEGAVIRPG
jgi:hypothetical protein